MLRIFCQLGATKALRSERTGPALVEPEIVWPVYAPPEVDEPYAEVGSFRSVVT